MAEVHPESAGAQIDREEVKRVFHCLASAGGLQPRLALKILDRGDNGLALRRHGNFQPLYLLPEIHRQVAAAGMKSLFGCYEVGSA